MKKNEDEVLSLFQYSKSLISEKYTPFPIKEEDFNCFCEFIYNGYNKDITNSKKVISDFIELIQSGTSNDSLSEFFPHCHRFVDQNNRIVWITQPSKLKETRFIGQSSEDALVLSFIKELFNIFLADQKIFSIIDLKGLKIKYAANKQIISSLKTIVDYSVKYFPNILEKCFIVGCPIFFEQIWNGIKATLSPDAILKVKITGNKIDPEIAQLIPISELPESMGGTLDLEIAQLGNMNLEEMNAKLEEEKNLSLLREELTKKLYKNPVQNKGNLKHNDGKNIKKKEEEGLQAPQQTPMNTLIEEDKHNYNI